MNARQTDSPRPQSKLGSSKRRLAYSLAAGAAAASPVPAADAAVIYSGIQNISINQFSAQNLDINGDAFSDIKLKNYVFYGGNYQGATVSYFPGQLAHTTIGFNYASALLFGDPIDSSSVGPSFYGSMAYGANNPNAEFNSKRNGYLGLSFPAGSDLHYGWVRVTVNNASGKFIIRDWAYESVPGAGILAGAPLPEPGTLGLLAAGALGVASMRRRRLLA